MKFLKKVTSLPTELEEGVLYYNETDGEITIKAKEKPKPYIILTYADGHVVENYTATTMTFDLVEGKTSSWDENTTLVNAVLNNGVTSIGSSTFAFCTSLSSITIPDSVTSIGSGAFAFCSSITSVGPKGSGTSIELPNTVTTIEATVFTGCIGLTSVTIPDSVTSIGAETFFNNTSLTSLIIPNSVIDISSRTFEESNISSLRIPDNIEGIGMWAFHNSHSLSSVTYKGVEYTSKSMLVEALRNNNVVLGSYMGNTPFDDTALTD